MYVRVLNLYLVFVFCGWVVVVLWVPTMEEKRGGVGGLCLERDAERTGMCELQDMTKLPYLNEPAVLWNLKARYMVDDVYTYTGSILIAINPFAPLSHLYGKHMMEQYRGRDLGDLSPHVYALSHEAFKCMMKEGKSQSILVRDF